MGNYPRYHSNIHFTGSQVGKSFSVLVPVSVPGPSTGRDVNGDVRSENGSHFTFNLAAKR